MTPQEEFIALIARMTKDQECLECNQDGNEPNPLCPDHEPWDMPGDDACETLMSLIDKARGLETAAGEGQLWHENPDTLLTPCQGLECPRCIAGEKPRYQDLIGKPNGEFTK